MLSSFAPLPVPWLSRALPFLRVCAQGGGVEGAPWRGWRRAHKGRRRADPGGVAGPARPEATPEASLPGPEPSAGAAAAEGGEKGACAWGGGCAADSRGARGKRPRENWRGIQAEAEGLGGWNEEWEAGGCPEAGELMRSRSEGEAAARGRVLTPRRTPLEKGPGLRRRRLGAAAFGQPALAASGGREARSGR